MFVKSKQREENISEEIVLNYSKKFDIHPIVMKQILARGYKSEEDIEEFLNPSEKSFNNPYDLNNMTEFVERLKKALETGEKILVFGDYDVDGISATAIMLKALKIFGINAAGKKNPVFLKTAEEK